jgi:hypothetical protein
MPISARRSETAGGVFRRAGLCPSRVGAWLALLIAAMAGGGHDAQAQGAGIAIVPPPPVRELARPGHPVGVTQAKQQFVNPEWAYDPNTGQSLRWDCTAKNWFDNKTNKPVGFQGGKARDGEVIPPPPKLELPDSERDTGEGLVARITQALQDPDNPERAYDALSKQFLIWDRGQKTWVEGRTGEAVGFLGRKGPTSCKQAVPAMARGGPGAPIASPSLVRELLFSERVGFAPSDEAYAGAGAVRSFLQMELILTSKLSLIGGGLRFASPPPQQSAGADEEAAPGCPAACSGNAACHSPCPGGSNGQLSRTVSASPARSRSALR